MGYLLIPSSLGWASIKGNVQKARSKLVGMIFLSPPATTCCGHRAAQNPEQRVPDRTRTTGRPSQKLTAKRCRVHGDTLER